MTPSLQGEPGTSHPVQGELPLRTGTQKKRASPRAQAAAIHRADLERLVPIIRRIAEKYGTVTIEDVRVSQGWLESKGRELAYLGLLPKRAGLVRVGFVRSTLRKAAGNLQAVWRLP